MASVSELGQKVKAKYPGAYDDMPDDEVGRSVKAKFPGQYDDFGDGPAPVAPKGPPNPREAVIGEEPGGFWRGVARGGWSIPGLVGLDYETATGAEMAVRDPDKIGDQGIGLKDRFSYYREKERERTRRAETENPVKTGLGIGVGATPSMAVMPQMRTAATAGILARAGASALTAGAQSAAVEGGVTGDLPPSERLKRMGVAGASGAALGALAPLASSIPTKQALSGAPGRVEQALQDYSVRQGRKVLTGNAGTISVKKPLSDEAVREALEQGAIRPFGTTQKAAEVLSGARERVGGQYGDILDALEAKGVTGPNAQRFAKELLAEAEATSAQTLGSPKPGIFRDIAGELAGGTKPGMHGHPIVIPPKPTANTAGDLGLTQAESMKRGLQHEAATEYDKLLGKMRPAGEAKVAVASRMRQAIEDAVSAQAGKAPDEAAAFEPVKSQLSRIIEGSNAAEQAAARASRNRGISLTDTIAGAAGMSHAGAPGAMAMTLANKMGRTRGPATASWVADKLARALKTDPQQFGANAPALLGAAERGPEALAAAHYVLSHSSPEYRARWQSVAADEEPTP